MSRRCKSSDPFRRPIRVVVIEPNEILGVGVREILERELDIELLAQVSTPAEAIPVVDERSPDVDVDQRGLSSTRRNGGDATPSPGRSGIRVGDHGS